MANDVFLKIGDIKGESRDAKHKDEIDVLSWSWGMSQPNSTPGGGGASKVSMQDIAVTKYIDAATAPLIMACVSGKHYPEAMLAVRKAGGKPLEYLKISLKDVLIKSQSTGSSGSTERLTENITLNFTAFKLEYTAQKDDGSAGATYTAAWNLVKNAKG